MKRTLISISPLLVIAAVAARDAQAVPPRANAALPSKAEAARATGVWRPVRTDFPGFVEQISTAGSDVYVGTRSGLLKSGDGGAHWQPIAAVPTPNALWARSPEEVYAATAGVLSRSIDHGQTWQPVATPAGSLVNGLWGSGGRELYAFGMLRGKPAVLYSEDAGKTMVSQDLGLKQGFLKAIGGTALDQVVVGGTDNSRAVLYRSADKGKTWKSLVLPVDKGRLRPDDWDSINGICFSDSGVLFVATSYSVFASKDQGAHWKRGVTTTTKELLTLTCRGNEVFAGGRGPTFLHSADEGKTWTTNELDQYIAGTPGETDVIAVAPNGEVYVGGVASFNPVAGALYQRTLAASKASAAGKYPGTDAGARQLLSDLRTGDAKALTATLKPSINDYKAVFSEEFASNAQKAYEALWAGASVVITADPANTALNMSKATRADLVKWTPQVEADFPGGYKKVAAFFKPGITVYRWKYTKPGDSLGMAFDGLIFVNDHWAWFPKPWKIKN